MMMNSILMSCPFNYDNTFPREYGGNIGGATLVRYLDYQKDSTSERLAIVGYSQSTDFLSQTLSGTKFSNFVIFEDAKDYKQLWAKELQSKNTNLFFTLVKIDLASNRVFIGSQNSPSIFILNALDGSKIAYKILTTDTVNFLTQDQLNSIHLVPHLNRLFVRITKGLVSTTPLTYFLKINIASFGVEQCHLLNPTGGTNYDDQVTRTLKVYQDDPVNPTKLVVGLQTYHSYSAVKAPAIFKFNYNPLNLALSSISGKYFSSISSKQFNQIDFYINSLGQEITLACVQSNGDIQDSLGSTMLQIMYSNDQLAILPKLYGLYPSNAGQLYIRCRDAIITSDQRAFVFTIDRTDTINTKLAITEIKIDQIDPVTSTLIGQETVLQVIASTGTNRYERYSRLFIFDTANSGQEIIYSTIGQQMLPGGTLRTIDNGYLFKYSLNSQQPLISSQKCGGVAPLTNSFGSNPSIFLIQQTVPTPSQLTSVFYFIDDSTAASKLNVQMLDLANSRLFPPVCPGSPAPLSAALSGPLIQSDLYYLIPVNTAPKPFPVYDTVLSLTQCEQNLLTYELRMQNPTAAVPEFVQLQRLPSLQIILNPFSSTSLSIGVYPMQIAVIDIYGRKAFTDFNVHVESQDVNYLLCYNEAEATPNGFALDHQYIIGSLWRHKLHIPAPLTSILTECKSLMFLQAYFVNSEGYFEKLPQVFTFEPDYQRISLYVPRKQRVQYDGTLYTIAVEISLKGAEYYRKFFFFKIKILKNLIDGCLGYAKFLAPVFPDYIQNIFQDIKFIPFIISDAFCAKELALLVKTAISFTNGNAIPAGCVTKNLPLGSIQVFPSWCGSSLRILEFRIEAWVEDPSIPFKLAHTQTTFKFFKGTFCTGNMYMTATLKQNQLDSLYYNIDQGNPASNFYYASVFGDANIYQISPTKSCGFSPTYNLKFSLENDLGFSLPNAFIIHATGYPQYHSYEVVPSSINPATDGLYQINIVSRYLLSGMPFLFPIHIMPATLELDLHMYRSSKCRLTTGTQPSHLYYYIKPLLYTETFHFDAFSIITEGCIYDRFDYSFFSSTLEPLPAFLLLQPSSPQFNISTTNLAFEGLYYLQLTGSLSPVLNITHRFLLHVEEYVPPNKEPPRFASQLMQPYSVAVQSEKKYRLPKIRDSDNNEYKVKVQYIVKETPTSTFPSFIAYNEIQREFRMNPMDIKEAGKYKFLIELTDKHKYPRTKTYTFEIEVTKYDPKRMALLQELAARRTKYVGIKVDNVTADGLLTINFNRTIFYTNHTLSLFDQFNRTSMRLKLKKAYTEQITDLSYKVINLTEKSVTVKLLFSKPSQISLFSDKDQLQVRFDQGNWVRTSKNVPQLLITEDSENPEEIIIDEVDENDLESLNFVIGMKYQMQRFIPKQNLPLNDNLAQLEKQFKYIKGGINGILFGNLILNILLQV